MKSMKRVWILKKTGVNMSTYQFVMKRWAARHEQLWRFLKVQWPKCPWLHQGFLECFQLVQLQMSSIIPIHQSSFSETWILASWPCRRPPFRRLGPFPASFLTWTIWNDKPNLVIFILEIHNNSKKFKKIILSLGIWISLYFLNKRKISKRIKPSRKI